jgi:hypothetical protein
MSSIREIETAELPRSGVRRPIALLLGGGWAMTALLEIFILIMSNDRHSLLSDIHSVLTVVILIAAAALAAYFFAFAARKAPPKKR